MQVNVRIVRGALKTAVPLALPEAGAAICFEGAVRPIEDGRELQALDYEAYEPMTLRELNSLTHDIACKHGLLGITVEHSTGCVLVGEVSFRLQVASRHRAEGIAAMDEFINRLKREVPLWKVPVFANLTSRTAT